MRRKNLDRALAVFVAEEYVDQFVSTLRMWAKSRQARREPKKRIRHIYIPEEVRNLRPRKPPTKAEQHAREVAEASRFKGQPKRY